MDFKIACLILSGAYKYMLDVESFIPKYSKTKVTLSSSGRIFQNIVNSPFMWDYIYCTHASVFTHQSFLRLLLGLRG